MTTEKAPVAGGPSGAGAGGASGLTPRQQQSLLSQALRGSGSAAGIRDINELFQLTARGAEGRAAQLGGLGFLGGAAGAPGSGAAAAAGVLTAVDEDGEGDQEATVPGDFEYFTDAEDMDE